MQKAPTKSPTLRLLAILLLILCALPQVAFSNGFTLCIAKGGHMAIEQAFDGRCSDYRGSAPDSAGASAAEPVTGGLRQGDCAGCVDIPLGGAIFAQNVKSPREILPQPTFITGNLPSFALNPFVVRCAPQPVLRDLCDGDQVRSSLRTIILLI